MTALLLIVLALVAGAFLPVQAAANARLAHFLGSPVRASMVSFAVGAIALVLVVAVFDRHGGAHLRHVPWWAWCGGFLGAFYVTAGVVVPVRIGAAAFFALLVGAQILMGLLIDRYGLFGFPHHAVTPARAAGAALVVAGVLLVRFA